jgi:beta-1,4-mannosyl-glycoprotein beta-1,4-N-acetylglucosaminyltransferase
MFFNEYDILQGRLEYLWDYVDYFVLVESNLTHSGQPKQLNFMKNMKLFKPYLDKILYFPFNASREQFEYNKLPVHDRDFETGPWQMENSQRNHIAKALEFFPMDATVLISDVDEIPHKECIKIAEQSFNDNWPIFAIQQTYFAYNFNQRMVKPWHGTVITKNKDALEWTPQGCRANKYNITVIPNGGWHLTYWGGIEKIRSKIQSFAHQELNNEKFTDPAYIKSRIEQGQDLYGRDDLEFIPTDFNTIPKEILKIFGKMENKHLQLKVFNDK